MRPQPAKRAGRTVEGACPIERHPEPPGWWSTAHLCVVLGAAILLGGCARAPESCAAATAPAGLDRMAEVSADDDLPFRFPLDASQADAGLYHAWFGEANASQGTRSYHAAEDYRRPAGTPVYAVADGRVSYSGPAGGYGWLVIVDHPQFNLYSLYGHLSPSRWSHEGGPVRKGELLGHLGDPWENGGSAEQPLDPHLHFGLRAGQRADYPPRGEWRWMAGWIRLCPQDLGWQQPSRVIAAGAVPADGYAAPDPGLLVRWGLEVLITLAYSAAGAGMLVYALRKKTRVFYLAPGCLVLLAGAVLHARGMLQTPVLLAAGAALFAAGAWRIAVPGARPQAHPPGGAQRGA